MVATVVCGDSDNNNYVLQCTRFVNVIKCLIMPGSVHCRPALICDESLQSDVAQRVDNDLNWGNLMLRAARVEANLRKIQL